MEYQVAPEMYVVFFGYLILMVLIGVLTSKYIRSLRDFYISSGLTMAPLVGTLLATTMSGMGYIGTAGSAYLYGYPFFAETFFPAFAMIIATTLFGPRLYRYVKRHKLITIPDFFEHKFGESKFLRILTIIACFIPSVFVLLGQYKAIGMVMQALWGWPYEQAVVVGAVIIILYCVLGGIYAVAWTDLVQYVVMMIATFVTFGVAMSAVGGIDGLTAGLKAIDPNLIAVSAPKGPVSWPYFFTMVFIVPLGLAANPRTIQRNWMPAKISYYRWLPMIGFVLWVVVQNLNKFSGMSVRVLAAQGLMPVPKDADMTLPLLCVYFLPPILGGLFISALTAAVMSTVDSLLIISSSLFVRDIYQKLINPNASERKLILWSRIVAALVAVVTLLLSFVSPGTLIVWLVWASDGSAAAMLFPAFLATIYWRRVSKWGVAASIITGLVVGFSLGYYNNYVSPLPFFAFFPATLASLAVVVIASLLTKPPKAVEKGVGTCVKPPTMTLSHEDGVKALAQKVIT
ncbi:MAG: sodium/solute symporter [Thermoproteota archaeon]